MKHTPDEVLSGNLKGKKVKLIRYRCFDWRYEVGGRRTLEIEETEACRQG